MKEFCFKSVVAEAVDHPEVMVAEDELVLVDRIQACCIVFADSIQKAKVKLNVLMDFLDVLNEYNQVFSRYGKIRIRNRFSHLGV